MKKKYMGKKKNKILLVFLSLGIGVLIYLLFRSRELFYYQFIKLLSLDGVIDNVRKVVWTKRKYIPNWVIYSLPDGLWMFSLGVSILYERIYYRELQKVYNVVYLSFFIFEFIQREYGGHGTVLGTFDESDLLCFTFGYFFASILGYWNWEKNYKYEKVMLYEDDYLLEKKKTLIIIVVFIIIGFFPVLI